MEQASCRLQGPGHHCMPLPGKEPCSQEQGEGPRVYPRQGPGSRKTSPKATQHHTLPPSAGLVGRLSQPRLAELFGGLGLDNGKRITPSSLPQAHKAGLSLGLSGRFSWFLALI